MTYKDLNQYYWLNKEIEKEENRLKEIEVRAYSAKTPNLTGMPSGRGASQSDTEKNAIWIAELKAIIAKKKKKALEMRVEIERYIADIPDSMTRQIFVLRVIDGLAWDKVAKEMGPPMTDGNARIIFHRHLSKNSIK